jgi:tetratricopeptide (TPR) repeat protein
LFSNSGRDVPSLDELIRQPIDGLSDAEALNHVGMLIDSAHDSRSIEGTERAFFLIDQIRTRELAPDLVVLTHYFTANAWQNKAQQRTEHDIWALEQPEVQAQILELRRAVRHEAFDQWDATRQCQVVTNLANQLDHIGRSIEAIELFDRVLAIAPQFAKALGNRGIAFKAYGRAVYDRGHAGVLMMVAHDCFGSAIAPGAIYDSDDQDAARAAFEHHQAEIEEHVDVGAIRRTIDLDGYRLGRGSAERNYRRWCLDQRLFLNPLNDLGAVTIAARDILTLPSLTVANLSAQVPPAIGFFNQMKQEFVSARYLFYEGMSADRQHYADRNVRLYNTLDYPSYALAVEKMRAAYRLAYSLLDKIAFFLNAYYELGHNPRRVNFRSVWYEAKGAPPRPLIERFASCQNWPLRGLFWLSKDLFEEDFSRVTEPDAEALKDIRDHLEHKYLQLHESWASMSWQADSGYPTLGLHLGRDEFAAKTLRVLKIARAALVYLSLAVHGEECSRKDERGDRLTMPMFLDEWRDTWKQ